MLVLQWFQWIKKNNFFLLTKWKKKRFIQLIVACSTHNQQQPKMMIKRKICFFCWAIKTISKMCSTHPISRRHFNSLSIRLGWLVGMRYLTANNFRLIGATFSWHLSVARNTVLNVPSPIRRCTLNMFSTSGIWAFSSAINSEWEKHKEKINFFSISSRNEYSKVQWWWIKSQSHYMDLWMKNVKKKFFHG